MTLLERVEGAASPDRDLDDTIARAMGYDPVPGWAPHYTSSLDAVLALVEEKLPGWHVAIMGAGATWQADVHPLSGSFTLSRGHSVTPALALLKAFLTALEAGDG